MVTVERDVAAAEAAKDEARTGEADAETRAMAAEAAAPQAAADSKAAADLKAAQ